MYLTFPFPWNRFFVSFIKVLVFLAILVLCLWSKSYKNETQTLSTFQNIQHQVVHVQCIPIHTEEKLDRNSHTKTSFTFISLKATFI